MATTSNLLTLLAVLLMLDAFIGLAGINFLQRKVPRLNIQRWALIETVIAFSLLIAAFACQR